MEKVVKDIIKECELIVSEVGYELPPIKYAMNGRLFRVLGRCIKRNYGTDITIELSTSFVNACIENNSMDILKNTILHEMCHALPKGGGHGTQWKHYAYIIGKKANTDINRIANEEDSALLVQSAKYVIVCQSCGKEYPFQRMPNMVKYNSYYRYRCGKCNGNLELKK